MNPSPYREDAARTPTRREAPAPQRPPLEWRVHAGSQRGARSPLPDVDDGAWELHVGPSAKAGVATNDLMLRSSGRARLRVSPDADGMGLRLQLLGGQARLDQRLLPMATDVPWRMYEPLHVGEMSLAYGSSLQPVWLIDEHEGDAPGSAGANGDVTRDNSGAFARSDHTGSVDGSNRPDAGPAQAGDRDAADRNTADRNAAHDAGTAHATHASKATGSEVPSRPVPKVTTASNWSTGLAWAGAALVIGSALLIALLQQLGFGRSVAVQPQAIERSLSDAGFEGLTVGSDAAGGLVIAGTLPSEKQRAALQVLDAKRQWKARMDVKVPGLTDQVTQFLVSNGVMAPRVENRGGGKVEAFTKSDKLVTPEDVERMKAATKTAIVDLEALEIYNESPIVASSCGKKFDDPGSRFTSVVWDDKRPMLNTANGKSYSVGSMLPTGHRIKSIDKERLVTLDCDGRLTQFRL
jgi:hypothetical protein